MKFITKKINESLFFQRKTITLFDPTVKQKIDKLIVELQNSGLIIEEPKCNFDVEMAMDMLDDAGKISAVLVFSGDSDLSGPLERIKVMGKQIGIVGVRGKTAGELHRIKNKYFDFGKFYNGKRTPFRSENPAKAGPRE